MNGRIGYPITARAIDRWRLDWCVFWRGQMRFHPDPTRRERCRLLLRAHQRMLARGRLFDRRPKSDVGIAAYLDAMREQGRLLADEQAALARINAALVPAEGLPKPIWKPSRPRWAPKGRVA